MSRINYSKAFFLAIPEWIKIENPTYRCHIVLDSLVGLFTILWDHFLRILFEYKKLSYECISILVRHCPPIYCIGNRANYGSFSHFFSRPSKSKVSTLHVPELTLRFWVCLENRVSTSTISNFVITVCIHNIGSRKALIDDRKIRWL